MKFIIHFEKRHFWLISILAVLVIGVSIAFATWTAPSAYHEANAVKVSISGTDYSLQEAITQGLIGGGTGADNDWTISGSNMYSAVTGNVGIGKTNPAVKLDVVGDIKASGTICDGSGNCVGGGLAQDNCYYERVLTWNTRNIDKKCLPGYYVAGIKGDSHYTDITYVNMWMICCEGDGGGGSSSGSGTGGGVLLTGSRTIGIISGKPYGQATIDISSLGLSDTNYNVLLTVYPSSGGNAPDGYGPLHAAYVFDKTAASFKIMVEDLANNNINAQVPVDYTVVRVGGGTINGKVIAASGTCLDGIINYWEAYSILSGGATCEHAVYIKNPAGPGTGINHVICPTTTEKLVLFSLNNNGIGGEAAVCVSSGGGGSSGGNLNCQDNNVAELGGQTGDTYCAAKNEVCVGMWFPGQGQLADECSIGRTGNYVVRCCSGGGGSGSGCQWLSFVNEIGLAEAIDNGYTGACYWADGTNYRAGYMQERTTTTSMSTTMLKCRSDGRGTQGNSDTAYYRVCS